MKPIEDEITFYVYSDEFFFAAQELEKSNNPGKVSTASYYLYGHSLELIFKSFLFKKGVTIKEMKCIGHDLEKALAKCIDFGIKNHLVINDEYLSIVRGVNKYYSKKEQNKGSSLLYNNIICPMPLPTKTEHENVFYSYTINLTPILFFILWCFYYCG